MQQLKTEIDEIKEIQGMVEQGVNHIEEQVDKIADKIKATVEHCLPPSRQTLGKALKFETAHKASAANWGQYMVRGAQF